MQYRQHGGQLGPVHLQMGREWALSEGHNQETVKRCSSTKKTAECSSIYATFSVLPGESIVWDRLSLYTTQALDILDGQCLSIVSELLSLSPGNALSATICGSILP